MPQFSVQTQFDLLDPLGRREDFTESELLYGQAPEPTFIESLLGAVGDKIGRPTKTRFEKEREKAFLQNQNKQLSALDDLALRKTIDPSLHINQESLDAARAQIIQGHQQALASGAPAPGFATLAEQQAEEVDKAEIELYNDALAGARFSNTEAFRALDSDKKKELLATQASQAMLNSREQTIKSQESRQEYLRNKDKAKSEETLFNAFANIKQDATTGVPFFNNAIKEHERIFGRRLGDRPPEMVKGSSDEIKAWATYLGTPTVRPRQTGERSLMETLMGPDIGPIGTQPPVRLPPVDQSQPSIAPFPVDTAGPKSQRNVDAEAGLVINSQGGPEQVPIVKERADIRARALGRDVIIYDEFGQPAGVVRAPKSFTPSPFEITPSAVSISPENQPISDTSLFRELQGLEGFRQLSQPEATREVLPSGAPYLDRRQGN